MLITFIGGLCCCALFSRHRNIFTLGILHGVLAAMAFVLLVPGVIDGFKPGPLRNNAEFLAYLRYDTGTIVAKPSTIITIPIEMENKSTAVWDSKEKVHPVHISYHLLDAAGNMIAYDNVRTSFPRPIEPGEALKIDLTVTVPKALGHYQLEIDIVKERVTWFKNKGSLTIRVPLVVSEKGGDP
jgi:hypothetical protein